MITTLFSIIHFPFNRSHINLLPYVHHIMVAPKGVNDNLASLKYCFPTGIPTMVTQYRIPSDVAAIARGTPVMQIHNRLSKKFPVVLLGAMTYFPNGKKHRVAILKHCFPTGIPIMVNDHSTPAAHQDSPIAAPPNRNQMMFPNMDNFAPSLR